MEKQLEEECKKVVWIGISLPKFHDVATIVCGHTDCFVMPMNQRLLCTSKITLVCTYHFFLTCLQGELETSELTARQQKTCRECGYKHQLQCSFEVENMFHI